MAEKVREPRQKRSIEKKRKIVTAGFQLFCEKGYYNTNTAEIAEYAGVSTGTVYSYFSDKADIYIAAFEDYLNEQTKNIMLGLKSKKFLFYTILSIHGLTYILTCLDNQIRLFRN